MKRIAIDLNHDGTLSPQPREGRSQSWAHSSVRHILSKARIRNLSALWDGEPRIAREEIAKHAKKITLRPMLRTYIATAIWDWPRVLGCAAIMMVPGARLAPHARWRLRCHLQRESSLLLCVLASVASAQPWTVTIPFGDAENGVVRQNSGRIWNQ